MQEYNDDELMQAAQSGSMESFEILISLHRKTVFRYLLRFHQPLDIVEDVCQETFLRLWINRQDYTASGHFTSYLIEIAKNIMLAKLRQRKICVLNLDESIPDENVPKAQDCVETFEFQQTIEHCLDMLPVHLSEVFREVVIKQKKYSEAAQLLNVPVGTIKSRMNEAIKRIRIALRQEGY